MMGIYILSSEKSVNINSAWLKQTTVIIAINEQVIIAVQVKVSLTL
jgi:hypothetical protein